MAGATMEVKVRAWHKTVVLALPFGFRIGVVGVLMTQPRRKLWLKFAWSRAAALGVALLVALGCNTFNRATIVYPSGAKVTLTAVGQLGDVQTTVVPGDEPADASIQTTGGKVSVPFAEKFLGPIGKALEGAAGAALGFFSGGRAVTTPLPVAPPEAASAPPE